MKILYGIQGTGNGHLTRARVMAPLLEKAGMKVDYVISGRAREKLFDMQPFGDYRCFKGLTFVTKNGHVNYVNTALHNNIIDFYRDTKRLQVEQYDLVLTDFEPITAWAGKISRSCRLLGIGHQYAFRYNIPKTNENWLVSAIMDGFAPVKSGIGLHWHHFDQPILPPIIERPELTDAIELDKIIVYLPFENTDTVIKLLRQFAGHRFFVYTADTTREKADNVIVKPLSRQGFQNDLYNSSGVICNAGFELASESLQMGKKILLKPLHGQMEQLSNALAMTRLEYGKVMHKLDASTIREWLAQDFATRVNYPDAASAIVQWIQKEQEEISQSWVDQVWESCTVETVDLDEFNNVSLLMPASRVG